MVASAIFENYFFERTLRYLKPQQGLSMRYQCQALEVTLDCKLTLTYGKYHLAMLPRELFKSEENPSCQQTERMAEMMNHMTIIQCSPSDFLHTHRRRAWMNVSIPTNAIGC